MKNIKQLRLQSKNGICAFAFLIFASLGAGINAQTFADPVLNPFGLTSVNQSALPSFVDLDGDGDMDLLVGDTDTSTGLGKFNYFENNGTSSEPVYGDPIINPFGLEPEFLEGLLPSIVDLDGDGDMDLSTIVLGDNFELIRNYYENIGDQNNPEFASSINLPYGLDKGNPPVYTDIDGDGDIDVFVDYGYGTEIEYYENIGSQSAPQFADLVVSPFGLISDELTVSNSVDIDNDGDFDLISTGLNADLYLHENIGTVSNPQFDSTVEIEIEISSYVESVIPTFADLDNDGDVDLLLSAGEGNMQYFENTAIVSTVDQFYDIELVLHPNPVSDVLRIETDSDIDRVEIFSATGELVEIYDGESSVINVNDWKNGMYVIKVWDDNGRYTTRKIVKK